MYHTNLNQLDQHLQQLPAHDLQALNHYAQVRHTQQRQHMRRRAMIVLGGLLTIGTSLWAVSSSLDGYAVLILTPLTLLVMIGALSGNRAGLISLALISALHSALNLLFIHDLSEIGRIIRLLIGGVQVLLTLYYIQQANDRSSAQMHTQQTLYQSVYSALYQSQPNQSNQLIALRGSGQTFIVWLRSQGVIMLLKGEGRLIFNTADSFSMRLTGKDTGGTQVQVKVQAGNQTYLCTLSRHDWLRYTLFAR